MEGLVPVPSWHCLTRGDLDVDAGVGQGGGVVELQSLCCAVDWDVAHICSRPVRKMVGLRMADSKQADGTRRGS